jgi:hypothetical protein
LFDQGWPASRIVALYASACLLLGFAALLPMSPLAKLLTLLTLFVAVSAWLFRLSTANTKPAPLSSGRE